MSLTMHNWKYFTSSTICWLYFRVCWTNEVLMFSFSLCQPIERIDILSTYYYGKNWTCPPFSWCFERPLQWKYTKHSIIYSIGFEAAAVLSVFYLCRYWCRELWSRKIYSSEETFWISIRSWAMGENLTYKCWRQFVHMHACSEKYSNWATDVIWFIFIFAEKKMLCLMLE